MSSTHHAKPTAARPFLFPGPLTFPLCYSFLSRPADARKWWCVWLLYNCGALDKRLTVSVLFTNPSVILRQKHWLKLQSSLHNSVFGISEGGKFSWPTDRAIRASIQSRGVCLYRIKGLYSLMVTRKRHHACICTPYLHGMIQLVSKLLI